MLRLDGWSNSSLFLFFDDDFSFTLTLGLEFALRMLPLRSASRDRKRGFFDEEEAEVFSDFRSQLLDLLLLLLLVLLSSPQLLTDLALLSLRLEPKMRRNLCAKRFDGFSLTLLLLSSVVSLTGSSG